MDNKGPVLTPEGLVALSVAQLHVWPASEGSVSSTSEAPSKAPIKSEAQQEMKGSAASDQVQIADKSKIAKENIDSATAVKTTIAKQAPSVSSGKDTGPQRGKTSADVTPTVTKSLIGLGGRSAYLTKVPRIAKPADGSANKPITLTEATSSHQGDISNLSTNTASTAAIQSVKEIKVETDDSSVHVKVESESQKQDPKTKSDQGTEKIAALSPTGRNLPAVPKRSLGELFFQLFDCFGDKYNDTIGEQVLLRCLVKEE